MNTQLKDKVTQPLGNTVSAIRKTRRAYIGLHGLAFERAQMRIGQARAASDKLFGEFIVKGEGFGAQLKSSTEGITQKTLGAIPAISLPTPFKTARIKAMQNDVAELQAKLDKMTKTKTAKSKTIEPIKTEITAEPKLVEDVPTKAAPAKAPATAAAKKPANKYERYYTDVLRYDAQADAVIVKKIVDHLGIALQSRDGQLVACTDEAERNTVRDNWLVKALRIKAETEVLDAKVLKVCEMMKQDRMKNRVTFYYLIAKNEGKLSSF